MADEPKEEKSAVAPVSAEKKEKHPPVDQKAEKAPAEKPVKKEASSGPASGKRQKINQLTIQEIETELKSVKEKMGGFGSHYAMHLLLRKKELTNPA